MMLRRYFSVVVFCCAIPSALFAAQAGTSSKTPAKASAAAFLPTTFAGWQAGATQVSSDAEKADAASAAVLQEYGLVAAETTTYTRDDNTLKIRALEFADATGAYGAYTFYRKPGMKAISVGKQGSYDGTHLVFWSGAIVCDAVFGQITAMSASDLRELTDALPKLAGGAATPPNLPGYLPRAGLDDGSERYAIGPVSYAQAGGVLPPALVDFHRGAEAITAQYSGAGGDGALTIVNYPTPQIAADRLRAIQAYLAQHDASAPQALVESTDTAIQTRRSGPLVILTTGTFSADRAKALAGTVHYDADVTWNHPNGYVSEESKAARLLLGIATLTAVLLGSTILIGFFFGGGRILFRKMRGKPATTLEEAEFIKLNLQ
jgi:hypothetical protein